MEDRRYCCIDLKSYYASVECVDRGLDPLATNLVVADESRSDGTICLAVSPSLKALGVPGRPRLFEVKQKLAEIERRTGHKVEYITAMPRMARYLEVSSEIYGIYLKYLAAQDIHVYSIDEAFMDLTPYLHLYGKTTHELVVSIIRDVLRETGITATGGIGTNLYLAKIAMDITAKKNARRQGRGPGGGVERTVFPGEAVVPPAADGLLADWSRDHGPFGETGGPHHGGPGPVEYYR